MNIELLNRIINEKSSSQNIEREASSKTVLNDLGFANIEEFENYFNPSSHNHFKRVGFLQIFSLDDSPEISSGIDRLVITAKDMTRDLVNSIEEKRFDHFEVKYLAPRVLVITGIESLKNRPSTSESLLNILEKRTYTLLTSRFSKEEIMADSGLSDILSFIIRGSAETKR